MMRRLVPAIATLAAILSAVPAAAQDKPAKAKPEAKQKTRSKADGKAEAKPRPGPEKDDAVTKKDKVIVSLDKFLASHAPNPAQKDWRTRMSEPPVQQFAADRDWFWHLATDRGEIVVRLMPDVAPMHCTNAIYLARAGFYDGLVFHRVIRGFMAQGGCPNGTGSGNAGYTMAGETSPDVKHDKPGLISTANEDGKEKTDGSQFFLTFAATPHLDGKHTIFGEVVEGMDVVTAIDALGGENGSEKPKEPITVVRSWIVVVAKDAKDRKGATPAGEGKDEKGGKPAPKGKGSTSGKGESGSGGE